MSSPSRTSMPQSQNQPILTLISLLILDFDAAAGFQDPEVRQNTISTNMISLCGVGLPAEGGIRARLRCCDVGALGSFWIPTMSECAQTRPNLPLM
jgi:hypothetical protein